MVGLLAPSTGGSVHLEGPQEVGGIPVVMKGEIHLVQKVDKTPRLNPYRSKDDCYMAI